MGYYHTNTGYSSGDNIREGSPIGISDLSGRSTGLHLHYTYQGPNEATRSDPMGYLGENNPTTPEGPSNMSSSDPAASTSTDSGGQSDFWSNLSGGN